MLSCAKLVIWVFSGHCGAPCCLRDMRVVCPQDVKKMLLKQARMVYGKNWAAKHECEELKEGV